MATVELLPLDDYEDGTIPFGPVELASDVTQIMLQVARCTTSTPDIWPNETTVISLDDEYSLDGGQSWASYSSAGAPGGIYTSGRTHQEVPFTSSPGSALPPEENAIPRLYRGAIGVTGGPLHSLVQAQVT